MTLKEVRAILSEQTTARSTHAIALLQGGRHHHIIAIVLAGSFTLLFFWLNQQKYLSFQVSAPDADRFNQAVWNTLQGRPLYATIKEGSILQNHFTPYLALLAPLFWLWQDVRILYLVQIIGFAVAGLLLYAIVYDSEKPHKGAVALIFLAAFFLNPNLHSVALYELRRVTLAMPFLALAVFSLLRKDRRLLPVSIFFSLLIKEEMGLVVSGIGLYLLVVERDWAWGISLLLGGFFWLLAMLQWVIPAFGQGNYPPIGYYGDWGSSVPEIIRQMVTNPILVIQTMFDQESLIALFRLLLPAAVLLPFVGADLLLISAPLLATMLLSSDQAMHSLSRWYLSSIIPFVYAAVALAMVRLDRRFSNGSLVAALALLAFSLLSYWLYGPGPGARHFAAYRYEVDDRDETGWRIIERLPEEAPVVAQVAFTTQVAHREDLRLLQGPESIDPGDYAILAEGYNSYPIPADELPWEIVNILADPSNKIVEEADRIYLLRQDEGVAEMATPGAGRTVDDSMRLEQFTVALEDADGLLRVRESDSFDVAPGKELRIELYWRAIAKPAGERTISTRLSTADGTLLAQHDSQPAGGSRPTSWWEPGWFFRELRYLQIPQDAPPGILTLDVVVYDSFSAEQLPFDNGEVILTLATLTVETTSGLSN